MSRHRKRTRLDRILRRPLVAGEPLRQGQPLTLGPDGTVRAVTVRLVADSSRISEAMAGARPALDRLDWQVHLWSQHEAAREWWAEQRAAMWARYGWEEPA